MNKYIISISTRLMLIFLYFLFIYGMICNIINFDIIFLFYLVGLLLTTFADVFLISICIFSKKFIIFSKMHFKKIDYVDIKKIILKQSHNVLRCGGSPLTLTIVLRNEIIYKAEIGQIFMEELNEKKLRNLCKKHCVKFEINNEK